MSSLAIVGVHPRDGQYLWERVARQGGARLSTIYENHEFDIPGLSDSVSLAAVVDHEADCSCGRADAGFDLIPRAAQVSIRNRGTAVIGVQFNAATGDLVTVEDGESLYWTFVETVGLYLTNASASPQTVRIALG